MEQKVFDGDFYKKLNTIKLHVKIPLNKGASGGRKSKVKGSSLEFSDFREYLLGDDIRHIDWNAYGRTEKLLVKLFMEEKEGRFHLFVDGSASMAFGQAAKSLYALKIAGALAYLILNNLDRVYLSTTSENGVVTSKGLTGKQSFARLLKQLEDVFFASKLSIAEMVKQKEFHGSGVTVLVSDFYLDNLEEVVKYLAYQKQQIILVQVLSREELEPMMEGNLALIDAENNQRLRISMGRSVKLSYQERLQQFLNHTQAVCRKYDAAYILAPSDQPLDKLFFESFSRAGILR